MSGTRARDAAAWTSFPLLFGGFVAIAAWGLARGYDPATFGAALTVVNFFVILAVEQVLPRRRDHRVFGDAQSRNDIGHGLLLAVLARPLGGALSVAVLAALPALRDRLGLPALWPADWPLAAQMVPGLFVWTFTDYWVHRSLHTFPRLWWFHALHHDTPQMHILKSGRLHFGEEWFNALLKPIPLLVLGAPPEVLAFIGMWIVFDGNLVHANIDQRFPSWAHWFAPTVQLHNLHHSQERRFQDTNYSGSTPIWDVLFGTFSHPDRCVADPLGLADSPVPRGFLAQVWFPFRAQLQPPSAEPIRSAKLST
jgi:sterol desaturase/sphingolipid hydroxylase (fatty acid hydroxylase superfamily)